METVDVGRGRERSEKRGRVVMDPLDEMDLRGDKWRKIIVSRGRGVKRKVSTP